MTETKPRPDDDAETDEDAERVGYPDEGDDATTPDDAPDSGDATTTDEPPAQTPS